VVQFGVIGAVTFGGSLTIIGLLSRHRHWLLTDFQGEQRP